MPSLLSLLTVRTPHCPPSCSQRATYTQGLCPRRPLFQSPFCTSGSTHPSSLPSGLCSSLRSCLPGFLASPSPVLTLYTALTPDTTFTWLWSVPPAEGRTARTCYPHSRRSIKYFLNIAYFHNKRHEDHIYEQTWKRKKETIWFSNAHITKTQIIQIKAWLVTIMSFGGQNILGVLV